MCDTVFASILFGPLSLLPENRYILLGLVSTSGIVYIVNWQRPSNRLGRVEVAITSVEETLEKANEGYARNHLKLIDLRHRLFETKLSASKMQTRMLDTRSVASYKEFVQYLQYVREIMRDIAKCAKEVEEIRTKTLRIIEAERQHQFSVGIKESREILDTITSSLTRLTTARRRNAPYDSMPPSCSPRRIVSTQSGHVTIQFECGLVFASESDESWRKAERRVRTVNEHRRETRRVEEAETTRTAAVPCRRWRARVRRVSGASVSAEASVEVEAKGEPVFAVTK
ncbi:hypothetical protein K438DRAFT_1773926 [Mycena galopus ATCC 62051]|nr:hypothetical protein K438DRAFT_1773926 [Mycena galopus ATCC 62051]